MALPAASPTKKLLIVLGVVLVVLIIALVGAKAAGLIQSAPTGVEVETAKAERRSLTQTVTASGKVKPEVEVKISSDVSGEILVLTVEEGDRVQAGQLLVQVQPEFYVAQREQASANLLQAEADSARSAAELLRARTDLERQRGLFERGVIAQADLQNAQANFDVAKANLDAAAFRTRSARATLRQSSQELRRTSIYAPISGVVSQLNVELGERVVGTSQMTGTEIMRIAELNEMLLEVDINENDIVNVTLEDSASVEVDAFPEQPFRGRVTQIANSARIAAEGTSEQITNFPVEIKIVQALASGGGGSVRTAAMTEGETETLQAPLRPGMSGTVDIFTATAQDAIVVPIQAVTVRDINRVKPWTEGSNDDDEEADTTSTGPVKEDLRRVVFVVRDGKVEMVEVTTGIADDTYIEILSGLNGDETVVTGPFRTLRTDLRPNQPVTVEGASRK